MDSITLSTRERQRSYPGDSLWVETLIEIDGRSLIELVRDVELPFAGRKVARTSRGQYVGIPPDIAFLPSRHLLGQPDELLSDLVRSGCATKPAVLMCECGEAGCWPLCMRVEVGDDVIRWTDFEQPHRAVHELNANPWRYDRLGPFTFDRGEYERALQRN